MDEAILYARQSQCFGKALAEHQAIQWIADAAVRGEGMSEAQRMVIARRMRAIE